MLANAQRDVVAVQRHGAALGLQRCPNVVDPRGVQRPKGFAAPQVEGLGEQRRGRHRVFASPGFRHQIPEEVQVHGAQLGRQRVAPGFAGDPHAVGLGQQLPQPGEVGRQCVSRPKRRLVGPDPIDQLIGRYWAVGVHQQSAEYAPLARVPRIEPSPVDVSLDVAEQPELHPHAVQLS